MAAVVLRLISDRFGKPSRQIEDRVPGGTVRQLPVWAARIVTARTVEDVFADPAGEDEP